MNIKPQSQEEYLDSDELEANRLLLQRKFDNDLANSVRWSRFSLIASIGGIALMLAGGAGALIIGAVAGPTTGGVVGGVAALSGTLINIFNHLVFNPARSANDQLNDTSKILVEEIKIVNALKMAGPLGEEDRNRYKKLIISKYLDLPEPTLEDKPSKITKKLGSSDGNGSPKV